MGDFRLFFNSVLLDLRSWYRQTPCQRLGREPLDRFEETNPIFETFWRRELFKIDSQSNAKRISGNKSGRFHSGKQTESRIQIKSRLGPAAAPFENIYF